MFLHSFILLFEYSLNILYTCGSSPSTYKLKIFWLLLVQLGVVRNEWWPISCNVIFEINKKQYKVSFPFVSCPLLRLRSVLPISTTNNITKTSLCSTVQLVLTSCNSAGQCSSSLFLISCFSPNFQRSLGQVTTPSVVYTTQRSNLKKSEFHLTQTLPIQCQLC